MARLIEATTYCPRISGMGRTHFTRYMARIGFAGPVIAFALTVLLSSMAVGQDAPPMPPKSTPAALDAFSSAANLQNNAAFDLASEEWEAFVKTYANDPLIFKAKHYLAVCRLQLKQYAQAEALLTEVVKAPKFELLEESLLNLGYCQYVQARAAQTKGGTNDADWKQKYTQAADTFRQQLKLFPKSKLLLLINTKKHPRTTS